MPQTAHRWTVEEVLALPDDGKRYELVAGELLVSPSPRRTHGLVTARLMGVLRDYLRGLGLQDCLCHAPADITWGLPPKVAEELVQPDVFVVHRDQVAGEWVDVSRLVLVAEVISPSSTRADRVLKRASYQRHGVATYWVVDPDAHLVEVWHPDDERPAISAEVLIWRLHDGAPELRIPLTELFAPPSA